MLTQRRFRSLPSLKDSRPILIVAFLALIDLLFLYLQVTPTHPIRIFYVLLCIGMGITFLWNWITRNQSAIYFEVSTLALLFILMMKIFEAFPVAFPWILIAEGALFLLFFLHRPLLHGILTWVYLLFFNTIELIHHPPSSPIPSILVFIWMATWPTMVAWTQRRSEHLVRRIIDLAGALTKLRSGSEWFIQKPPVDLKKSDGLALELVTRSGDAFSRFDRWWRSTISTLGPFLGLAGTALYMVDPEGHGRLLTAVPSDTGDPKWRTTVDIHDASVRNTLEQMEPFFTPAGWLQHTEDRWMNQIPLNAEGVFLIPVDAINDQTVIWMGITLQPIDNSIRAVLLWLTRLTRAMSELYHAASTQQDQLEILSKMNAFGLQIAKDLSVNDVLNHFIRIMKFLVPFDGGIIALARPEHPEDLSLYWSEGIDPSGTRQTRMPRHPDRTSWTTWIVQHREEIIRVELKSSEKELPIWSSRGPQPDWTTLLGIPLKVHQETVGVTLIGRIHEDFRAEEIQWLSILSTAAALAFRNAQLYERIQHQAQRDGLTGTYNHRVFQERLEHHLVDARRPDATFREISLLLLDIDHFKQINDTYGHPFGDEVLKRVAGAIQESVRNYDTVARYGGEEFAVILPGCNQLAAMKVAETIRERVTRLEFKKGLSNIQVTVSGGVATFPDDAQSRAELVERADVALYHAKRNGRNQIWHWQDVPTRVPPAEKNTVRTKPSWWERLLHRKMP